MLINHRAEAQRLGQLARDKAVATTERSRLTARLAYLRNAARPNERAIARIIQRLEELDK